MPFVAVENSDLYYRVDGNQSGDWLVLVHGVGADHESWNGIVDKLKDQYRIVRIDLRGHGKSCKLLVDYRITTFSEDLESILDELSITRLHLVGFSLGGLIVQQFALDNSTRLNSLVILSSIAGRTIEEKKRVLERAKLLQTKGAKDHLTAATDRWFTKDFIEANPEVMEWRRNKSLQNDPVCYANAYRVLAETDLVDRLVEIKIPVLAVTGEEDIGSPPHMTKTIARLVQNGRAVILPKLKHSILLEAPGLVSTLLKEFFEEH